ncbi:GNAT family N-acetyltransferase [Streptantibioticus cattleyicolor]|uniref:N-acetyltransferase domain-containing protein n=1 Tax=Streptantibioticus cattleyicolor (strain ATCC 35852 / DSM 46488 / JCM 4925 / NBRC 14057 / NRRL 8057) TaxID=1003195 RepID=F8JIY0_STREN|nr:GNAT family N-acetyltransferase [Streptantibioticus cattleyicolor]AEW98933.1 hypothetical protein SCATT_p07400 [Streptantibioticus cattleyicolor NRRL 8057 = DSM 46488]CCB72020.1 conserved protein of unknown function [Streptantibioticus cattleyicolor NRRL 8057 = DSM 46488]
MDAGIVRDWIEDWVVSRGAAPPRPEPWGYTVDVGLPDQVTRHVLTETDRPLIRKLTENVTAPGTWLKVFLPAEEVAPAVGPGWRFDDPCFLMSTALSPAPVTVPDGYRLRTWARGGVVQACVFAADGAFAARGRIARPPGATAAVVDQVETAPAHRRKGLGGVVMRTLANAAAETGATTGVLGATRAGRALYETLGWHTDAPLTGLVRESPPA